MTVDVDEQVELPDANDEVSVEPVVVQSRSRISRSRWVGLALAAVALILAAVAGYLTWQDDSARLSRTAAVDSVRAATQGTTALLSYHPESVDAELKAATDRLTGGFRDQYTQLVNTVVAPGAKQKHISAVATVPAAASVSASENHAVVLVFVNQTTAIGNDTPTGSTSSVRVGLDKVNDRWLISQFDPV
jgi:Mce-associated membrane protein